MNNTSAQQGAMFFTLDILARKAYGGIEPPSAFGCSATGFDDE